MRILVILRREGGRCAAMDQGSCCGAIGKTEQVKQNRFRHKYKQEGRYGRRDRRAYSSKYRHDRQDIEDGRIQLGNARSNHGALRAHMEPCW